MDNKKHINFLFRRIDPDHLKKLFERELSDQEPCYYRKKPDESGFEMFHLTVIDSVSDFVFYNYTRFDAAKNYDSEIKIIKNAINMLFRYDISRYYHDADCSNYGIKGLFESRKPEELKRLRRIQEVRDTIEFQMEIQYPCNFDDGEEYADFCIGEGMRFFYGDEDYERKDDIFADETEDHMRDEIEEMMIDEYYNQLVEFWEENKEDC
tara:strand:- start:2648 stop:3274 length:627 start_codon:yes stop_codon:yes gene_type:complete